MLLAAKIVAAVAIVVAASRATERAGPFVGSMIATLPVSTGPVYVFLAIDHGAAFVSESARMSVASTAAIVAFVAAHALAAQRYGTLRSLAIATLAWLAVALLLQLRDWRFAEVCILFVAAFAAAIHGLRRYAEVGEAPRMPRTRYDLALRAGLVAMVVLATTAASHAFGPSVTGVLATYPVVFTSLILILQPRCGGPFTAAMLVNGLKGLLGFGVALLVLHLAAARMSAAPALMLALAVSLGWNGVLVGLRRLRRPQALADRRP
ncbi:MAG TPA: hypothetical protein VLA41_13590 [Burkholderiales bacterium]|nr:hypothetical protein [Burkholderiales bacterium]